MRFNIRNVRVWPPGYITHEKLEERRRQLAADNERETSTWKEAERMHPYGSFEAAQAMNLHHKRLKELDREAERIERDAQWLRKAQAPQPRLHKALVAILGTVIAFSALLVCAGLMLHKGVELSRNGLAWFKERAAVTDTDSNQNMDTSTSSPPPPTVTIAPPAPPPAEPEPTPAPEPPPTAPATAQRTLDVRLDGPPYMSEDGQLVFTLEVEDYARCNRSYYYLIGAGEGREGNMVYAVMPNSTYPLDLVDVVKLAQSNGNRPTNIGQGAKIVHQHSTKSSCG